MTSHTFNEVLNALLKGIKTKQYYYVIKSRALAKEDYNQAEAIENAINAFNCYKRIKKIKTL